MRKVKNTVPAFTVMEVTISMLVAAIVVAMAYSAYGIIAKSWLGFTEKNRQMAVVLCLDELLRRDFEKATLVEQEQGGILISGGERFVQYQIGPEQVLRISSITDTFKIKPLNLQACFEGKPLEQGQDLLGFEQALSQGPGTVAGSKEGPLIDEITFSVSLQNAVIPFHYKKKYSAESLMAINP